MFGCRCLTAVSLPGEPTHHVFCSYASPIIAVIAGVKEGRQYGGKEAHPMMPASHFRPNSLLHSLHLHTSLPLLVHGHRALFIFHHLHFICAFILPMQGIMAPNATHIAQTNVAGMYDHGTRKGDMTDAEVAYVLLNPLNRGHVLAVSVSKTLVTIVRRTTLYFRTFAIHSVFRASVV